MTEQEGAEERVSTGVAEVDEVIASLEGLDGRPVEEHVEVYESAHDRLRRALDGADGVDGVDGVDGADGVDGVGGEPTEPA